MKQSEVQQEKTFETVDRAVGLVSYLRDNPQTWIKLQPRDIQTILKIPSASAGDHSAAILQACDSVRRDLESKVFESRYRDGWTEVRCIERIKT